jgi:hypothetical protein
LLPSCPAVPQDLAWGYLATGSAVLQHQVLPRLLRVPVAAALLHPTLRRCPSYHKGHSYAAGVLKGLEKGDWYAYVSAAYEVHLMGCELWDLWPWLLDLLEPRPQQQPEQQQQQQQAITSSSSSTWREVTCPGQDHSFWPLVPHAVPTLLRCQGSSSSGGCSSGGHKCVSNCQPTPVSASQLSLVLERVCLNVQLSTYRSTASLNLLVLLLLRADPALRLAFLQGPQGGLLLAALQLYACGRTPLHEAVAGVQPGLVPEGLLGWACSPGVGLKGLQEVMASTPPYGLMPAPQTAGLVLSWLLLQLGGSPAGGNSGSYSNSHSSGSGGGRHESSSSSSSTVKSCSASRPPVVAWAPGPLVRFGEVAQCVGG